MGDSSAVGNRSRKSTMSKIGRVFGLSSTNLAHDALTAGQQPDSSYNSKESLSEISSENGFHHALSKQSSTTSLVNEYHASGKNSPLNRSRPHSPVSNSVSPQIPPSQQQAPVPHHAPPALIPSRQSSLRVPHASVGSAPDTKKSNQSPAERKSPVDPHALSTSSLSSVQLAHPPASAPMTPAQSAASPQMAAQQPPPSATTLSRSSSITSKTSSSTAPNQHRFVMLENATHEHHLKNAKRQEKIGHMIKDLLGAKKLRSEAVSAVPNILSSVIPPISENETEESTVPNTNGGIPQGNVTPAQQSQSNVPPTLLTGLINQVKRGEITQYSGAAMSHQPVISATSTIKVDSRSFVEKYGRCQEVIGRGAFGVVRVSHKKDKTSEVLYAVKEFKRRPQESDKKYSRRLTSEFCISSSLQHANIIHTLDLLQDAKGDYCEVMEFCSGGDLYSLIITAGKLEYIEADCFFKQLMRGVNYMHEMGVAHRDLKPENLLLTANGTLKITDFGNSELFRTAWETDIHLSGGICGSSPYIAPEEYTANEFDPRKVDIWSCGVIYMAMRTGRQLWKLATAEDEFYSTYLEKRKDAKGYEPIETLKRARCRNVIYSILDPVPSRRITSKQILNSEWCREIKLCLAGEGK